MRAARNRQLARNTARQNLVAAHWPPTTLAHVAVIRALAAGPCVVRGPDKNVMHARGWAVNETRVERGRLVVTDRMVITDEGREYVCRLIQGWPP